MTTTSNPKPAAVPSSRDRAAFRAAYEATIAQLKKIPAFGTPGRAGSRSK